VRFEFYRFRFSFCAEDSLYFPAYQSGNILRGAFGAIFRRLDPRAFARVFAPLGAPGQGPSGLRDFPRPFVFRAWRLDGRTVQPAEPFHFDVHMFDVRRPAIAGFVAAFAELAREGLGPSRGRARLASADQLDLAGAAVRRIYAGEQSEVAALAPPCMVDLAEPPARLDRVLVRFLTPTELKAAAGLAERPEFPILFARLRDRISALRAVYGAGPLEIDFRAMGGRAAAVRMTRCELRQVEAERRSSRTGRRHPLGGFVGEAEYEGALAEFGPYLRLGRWVGVGRQTVWGKGEIQAVAFGEAS
jgi:hypothetical protein